MPDLSYSDDALNVISAFYEAEKLLYVEGDDDVVFWELVLEQFGIRTFKVQSVGGIEELKKYINKVASGVIDANVARDADFSYIQKPAQPHQVIYTYGHSIENTLFTPGTICSIIRAYGRMTRRLIDEGECETWMNEFHSAFEQLVTYDAANETNGHGLSVLGQNCTRFMTGDLSPTPDTKKIQQKIDELDAVLNIRESASTTREDIKLSTRLYSDFMRGHFLMSAVLKYMNHKLKRLNGGKKISIDALFSNAISAFQGSFNQNHQHYDHYKRQIDLL